LFLGVVALFFFSKKSWARTAARDPSTSSRSSHGSSFHFLLWRSVAWSQHHCRSQRSSSYLFFSVPSSCASFCLQQKQRWVIQVTHKSTMASHCGRARMLPVKLIQSIIFLPLISPKVRRNVTSVKCTVNRCRNTVVSVINVSRRLITTANGWTHALVHKTTASFF